MNISVVVPAYNEVESLPELTAWIKKVMNQFQFSYEIILIDDGSNDGSWQKIEELKSEDSAVRGIKFRRNYGKSAALNVGFAAAQGEVIITMMPICRTLQMKFQNFTEELRKKNWT
jgi:glycosyltransferase involved in cell wall biosynthesis